VFVCVCCGVVWLLLRAVLSHSSRAESSALACGQWGEGLTQEGFVRGLPLWLVGVFLCVVCVFACVCGCLVCTME
jgi:hypothetical protein